MQGREETAQRENTIVKQRFNCLSQENYIATDRNISLKHSLISSSRKCALVAQPLLLIIVKNVLQLRNISCTTNAADMLLLSAIGSTWVHETL